MALVPSHIDLDDDQQALLATTREFCENTLLPLDRKCDVDESSITQLLPQMAEMGLLALLAPESLGGLGCPYPTYVSILHEVSRSSPSAAVTLSVHALAGSILDERAAEPKRTEWLSRWGRPESFAAFALSEAEAGSDAANVKTTATRVDGGFRVHGEKMWITNGLRAKWFLTLARLSGAPVGEGLVALLVDGSEPGLERTEIHGKLGIRASETAVISFNDVFVPDDHLIGEPGRGLEVFLSGLDRGRLGIAAQATGIAEACLTDMVSYANQREQFGRPIGELQAVANMIADSAVELEAARSLIWRGALAVEAGGRHTRESSMAKLYASEAANRIAYRAIQVHGGTGYVRECRAEQLFRDARVTTIYEGTSEIQRLVIARELAAK